MHTVSVKPNDKKIVAIPIDGPYTGDLDIVPAGGGKLITSAIKIQDNMGNSDMWLWSPVSKSPQLHKYRVMNAYSGQEFVSITGLVTVAGSGGGVKGKLPPFQVTVPEVDVDWEGFEAWEMEQTEDSNVVLLPVATTDAGRRKFFVREPSELKDSMFPDKKKRDYPNLYLSWDSGIQVYTNNILISAMVIEIKSKDVKTWPLVFYASQNKSTPAPAGAMTIRLERKPTEHDVNGEITYDEIKCKAIRISLKEGQNFVEENAYIYINAIPQMPQLTASLKPTGLSGDAKWRLYIEYKRSPRNDDEYYPGPTASSWKTLSTEMPWDIAKEFGTAFRGGKATLYCEYQAYKFSQVFHIRTYNATEAAVASEIGSTPWYVKPIARHESGTQNNRTYIQFNEIGTLGPNSADIRYCPNFGDPNGWGIMQLDPPPSDETLWNWKQNIADGKSHLANPCRTGAVAWITEQERQQQLEEPTKPLENYVFTFNGVDFQKGTAQAPTDACTIQRYNGAASWVIYWKNKTDSQPGSWEINEAYREYVDAVCGEVQ